MPCISSSPNGAAHCFAPLGLSSIIRSATQGLRPGLSCAAPSGLKPSHLFGAKTIASLVAHQNRFLTMDRRVEVQQRIADAGPRGGLGRVERLVDLRVADGEQLLRRGRVR